MGTGRGIEIIKDLIETVQHLAHRRGPADRFNQPGTYRRVQVDQVVASSGDFSRLRHRSSLRLVAGDRADRHHRRVRFPSQLSETPDLTV